jgi:hypothetical protein
MTREQLSANICTMPTSYLKAKATPLWIRFVFAAVIVLTVVQLMQTASGMISIFGNFLDPLSTQTDYLSDPAIRGQVKAFFAQDNYHRCQNKLGIQPTKLIGDKFPNAIELTLEEAEDVMDDMFAAGMRYVHLTVYVSDIQNYVAHTSELIHLAYLKHLTPIVMVESPTGAGEVSGFFKQLSTYQGYPNPFIAITAPLISGEQDPSAAWQLGVSVAADLASEPNILIGTPLLKADVYEQIQDAIRPTLSRFDVMIVDVDNADENFGIRTSNQSDRGYGQYAGVPRQLLLEHNATPYGDAQPGDADAIYPHMSAIIMRLDVSGGKDQDVIQTMQRIEYDFGQFSDDPTVLGVIISKPFTEYLHNKGFTQYMQYYARLATEGTNCNYDIVEYPLASNPYDFHNPQADVPACNLREVQTAASSDMKSNASTPDKSRAKVVCADVGGGLHCRAEIQFTMQIGMPIRYCGSNSPIGTDTRPYPSPAYYASNATNDGFNYYNQFAGELQLDGFEDFEGTYMMPWLGNCINNTAEALKSYFQEANEPWMVAQNLNKDGTSPALHANEMQTEQFRSTSSGPWTSNGFSLDLGVNGQAQVPVLDEESTVFGSRINLDKRNSDTVQALRQMDLDRIYNRGTRVSCPGEGSFAVIDDPQNMIYGPEVTVLTKEWDESPSMLCFKVKSGEIASDDPAGLQCQFEADIVDKPDCTCDQEFDAFGNPLPLQRITAGSVGNRSCKLNRADREEVAKRCVTYQGGAATYEESDIWQEWTMPTPTTPTLKGGLEAVNTLTQFVDRKLAESLVNNLVEDLGWRGEIIMRSYNVPVGNSNHRVAGTRVNNMLEFTAPVSQGGSLNSANSRINNPTLAQNSGPSVLGDSEIQCNVGVNLANWPVFAADDVALAKQKGYTTALVIVSGDGSLDNNIGDVLASMCKEEITPVVRSCAGRCSFIDGEAQAEYLNKWVIPNLKCETHVICGHNEPESENANGLVNEGQWAQQCVENLDQSPLLKVMSPVFNATHPGLEKHLEDFNAGFGLDMSVFDCIGANTYSGVPNDFNGVRISSASDNLSRFIAAMQSKGLGTPEKLCITETGVITGSTGVSDSSANSAALTELFTEHSNIEFALGFNWLNTNPDFKSFAPDDGGSQILENVCNIQVVDSETPGADDLEDPGFRGEIFYQYDSYPTDGLNWRKYEFYMPKMGYIDELMKQISLYSPSSGLPKGEFRTEPL